MWFLPMSTWYSSEESIYHCVYSWYIFESFYLWDIPSDHQERCILSLPIFTLTSVSPSIILPENPFIMTIVYALLSWQSRAIKDDSIRKRWPRSLSLCIMSKTRVWILPRAAHKRIPSNLQKRTHSLARRVLYPVLLPKHLKNSFLSLCFFGSI